MATFERLALAPHIYACLRIYRQRIRYLRVRNSRITYGVEGVTWAFRTKQSAEDALKDFLIGIT